MQELLQPRVDSLAASLFRQLKRTADDVIVSCHGSRATQIKFANNVTAKAAAERQDSISVFYVKDRRVVFTTLREPIPKAVQRLAQGLPKAARVLQPSSNYYGIAKGAQHYSEVRDCFDPRMFNAMADGGMDFVDAAINASLKEGAKRASGVLELGAWQTRLRSSGGADATSNGTRHYLSLRALYDSTASGHQVAAGRMMHSLAAERVGSRAGQLAFDSRNPSKAPAGSWDVVFDSLPWAALLGNVGDAASIFSVESGFSFLANKLNHQVASPALTLHDDGRLPDGFSSSQFDAEGVPTQRTTLIQDGVLRTYLHNTSTAKKHGAKSTGNAGMVAPSPNTLVVDAGKENTAKLLSRVRKGIFITNLWYTRFQNYATGDFSTIPRDAAFLIRNGQLEKPVHGLRVSENFPRLLQSVQAVSAERQQVHGWEAQTPVLCSPALAHAVRITRPTQ